jgi:glycosyltransferase involved in cell wall biosynthesis
VVEQAEAAPTTRDPRLAGLRRIAIVPAYNEEESIRRVIDEIRAYDPELEIVVVDDGSHDRTAAVAEQCGAHVVRLPFNLGIGGAVQTGFRYAFENGFRLAVRLDGDGQHDASQLDALLAPVLADEADIAVGSRFAERSGYQSSRPRRLGITILAKTVSVLVRRKVTDPTSGFQALSPRALALYTGDWFPTDYPDVDVLLAAARAGLRVREVPVKMAAGVRASTLHSGWKPFYYVYKMLLSIWAGTGARS